MRLFHSLTDNETLSLFHSISLTDADVTAPTRHKQLRVKLSSVLRAPVASPHRSRSPLSLSAAPGGVCSELTGLLLGINRSAQCLAPPTLVMEEETVCHHRLRGDLNVHQTYTSVVLAAFLLILAGAWRSQHLSWRRKLSAIRI